MLLQAFDKPLLQRHESSKPRADEQTKVYMRAVQEYSCCIGLSNGSNGISQNQPNFDPSQLGNRSANVDETWTYNQCRKTTHHGKRYFDRTTWVVWAIPNFPLYCKISSFVFFFGFFVTHTDRTGGPILTVTWCLSTQACTFWGFWWYTIIQPHLWGQIPQNRNFSGRE